MDHRIDEVVSFYTDRDPKEWFFATDAFDNDLRSRFSDLVKLARTSELDSWADTPHGALALIILLDQIPRNIWRGSGQAYVSDLKAQDITTQAITRKFDHQIGGQSRVMQILFYMPYMHAENLLAQVAAHALFQLGRGACEEGTEDKVVFGHAVAASQRHLDCIAKLGRFPKRNEYLGRTSTDEEIKFLEEHPMGF